MHRFQTKSTIFRIRIASALLIFGTLLAVTVVVLLIVSFLHSDRELAVKSGLLGGLAAVSLVLHLAFAQRTHCPLCMTPVLARKHCSKHRRARTLLGSHRFRVAVAALFRGQFTCPYCNERSQLKVREKRR